MTTPKTDTDLEEIFQGALAERRMEVLRQQRKIEKQKLETLALEDAIATQMTYKLAVANQTLCQVMRGSASVNAIIQRINNEPLELASFGMSEPIVMSLQIRRLNPPDFVDSFAVGLYVGPYNTTSKYGLTRPHRTGLYSLGRAPDEMRMFLERIADPVELTKEMARLA